MAEVGTPAAATPTSTPGLPDLRIDPTDPSMTIVSATVLSIRGHLMRRFELARPTAPSHTVLILEAVKATAQDLPSLVAAARPSAAPGDLFPARPLGSAGSSAVTDPQLDRPEPLRIRPTVGELTIIDGLAEWVTSILRASTPRAPKVNRSELVSAALDSYLPPLKDLSKPRRS
ncbi:hypothetical protein ACQPXM_41445 (plasmid) [Kribbella sp. CA-253562]|uniref:hypothetical protein n=1 Tax=Kribbella sp. CA-253562 TaxID=3239942 RepID=UPI003D8B452A